MADVATGVQIATTAVVAIATLVVAGATVYYARKTRDLSDAAKRQTEAAQAAVEEMREQRYSSLLPVMDVVFSEQDASETLAEAYNLLREKWPETKRGYVKNIGIGPALDVRLQVKVQDEPAWCVPFFLSLPVNLALPSQTQRKDCQFTLNLQTKLGKSG